MGEKMYDLNKFSNKELLSEIEKRMSVEEIPVIPTKPAHPKFYKRIPNALEDPSRPLKTRGKYQTQSGYPDGIILHFVANRYSFSAQSYHGWMRSAGLAALYLDGKARLWQNQPLDEWGLHAGTSKCPVTGRTSVSRYYIGLETAAPGRLTKMDNGMFEAWFGKQYPADMVRYVKRSDGYVHSGYYGKFTEDQEAAMLDFCVTMVRNFDMNPELVLGHDEVAPERKNDLGGALSMNMDDFRKEIKRRI